MRSWQFYLKVDLVAYVFITWIIKRGVIFKDFTAEQFILRLICRLCMRQDAFNNPFLPSIALRKNKIAHEILRYILLFTPPTPARVVTPKLRRTQFHKRSVFPISLGYTKNNSVLPAPALRRSSMGRISGPRGNKSVILSLPPHPRR